VTGTRERVLGVALLATVALALVVTSVHGVFTVDEDNYLVNVVALRAGRLSVSGTDGLPPTRELLYFDPGLDEHADVTTPVVSTAPPLYAPLALPFSYFGWYGLVALNAIALVATAGAAFVMTARRAQTHAAPYVAALTALFGGYAIEYAQGVWPQMLSMALVFGAFYWAVRSEELASPRLAILAGALAGLACGVRYPNAVSAAALLGGLLLFSAQRFRSALAFAGGASVPIVCSSILNHARSGLSNPIDKGTGYLRPGEAYSARWLDALRCAVARFIDFSAQAPLQGHAAKVHFYMQKSAETGVYLIGGAVKKAWLQSMPWVGLALVVLVLACRPRGEASRTFPARLAGLVVFAMLGVVAWSGSSRVDGFCFNQRYLLDLLPFAAVAVALAADELPWRPKEVVAGVAIAAALLAYTFSLSWRDAFRQHSIAKVPLGLAVATIAAFAWRRHPVGASLASGTLAAALAWSLGVHLLDDLPASRRMRELNAERLESAAAQVKGPAACFAYWGGKDALGPLALDRSVVIADVWADGAEAAPALRDEFLRQGRRVYLAMPIPDEELARVVGTHRVARLETEHGEPGLVYELFP
jgi:hypothetical protein